MKKQYYPHNIKGVGIGKAYRYVTGLLIYIKSSNGVRCTICRWLKTPNTIRELRLRVKYALYFLIRFPLDVIFQFIKSR